MELLVLVSLLAVPLGLVSVLMEAWRASHDKKRSIATALAITCITAAFPTVIMATYFETQQPSGGFQQPLQIAGIVLMFGAGISGAIGLVWDRRIARLQPRLEAADRKRNNLQERGLAESDTTADQPRE